MAIIRCHHCGGTHSSVAEVRECARTGSIAAEPAAEFWADSPAADSPAVPAAAPLFSMPPAQATAPLAPPDELAAPDSQAAAAGQWRAVLGRSVLVKPGQPAPAGWERAVRVVVDPVGGNLEQLERLYRERTPAVLEIAGELPSGDEVCTEPVWSLGPRFFFPGERLAHALTANSIDARSGSLQWRLAGLAAGLGAAAGGPADVVLPDGTPAFCDGGPLEIDAAPPGAALVHRLALEQGALSRLGDNVCDAALAPDQLAAVTHRGAAARVIAPAGSGKTRVLTERARHLLRAWRVPASAVCLVAYNRRAAEEMVQRTKDLPGLRVRTLNSLALSIASGSGAFGGGRIKQTIDERAVRDVIESLVTFPRRVNTDPAAAWIEALSSVRLGLRSPSQVEAEFNGDVDGLTEVFDRYRMKLANMGSLDFDDQIYSALEVLLTDTAARRRARANCRIMLVDEFQDLTPAHLLMIRLLAGPDGWVFGVGDDDQTIYGYSDASPDWLIDYAEFFPSAGAHGLEVNYRCPPAVVDAARTLLTHNRRRVEKEIRAAPERAAAKEELVVETGENPVAATASVVAGLLEKGIAPASIAVLTRVNHSLAPVQIALGEAGIPVVQAVDTGYLQRTGVRAALAWLRMVRSPRLRRDDVLATARRPSRALSPKAIEWMSEQRSVAMLRSLAARLSDRDAGKVEAYAADIEMLSEMAEREPVAAVLEALRDSVGLAAAIEPLDLAHRRLDRSPQTDDLDVLVELARLCPEEKPFDTWLKDALSRPSDPEGVMLATVHSVKGREWDRVIVHEASSGLMPHRLAMDLEEERRVFHVAITRGRHGVTVVTGRSPSRFIDEMSTEWVEPARPAAQPDSAAGELIPLIGMRVRVGGYAGVVSSIDNQGVVARVDGSVIRIPYGQWVEADGLWGRFVAAGSASPEPNARLVDALKAWRLEKAKAEGKPAYVYLHDSTIAALAASGARNMRQLALVKGIGPSKLEAYGDELLAVLEAASD